MESEGGDRSSRKIFKVIVAGLLGAALGLFAAIAGFEQFWQHPIELQPIHLAIVAGASLFCGSLAAIDIKKFLDAFFQSPFNF
jgi:ABC-type antimicrobial peptide transport system permease subunit